jgi:outer membrane protein assembly factor BamE (lipoprotein component of BamABCDE complex)
MGLWPLLTLGSFIYGWWHDGFVVGLGNAAAYLAILALVSAPQWFMALAYRESSKVDDLARKREVVEADDCTPSHSKQLQLERSEKASGRKARAVVLGSVGVVIALVVGVYIVPIVSRSHRPAKAQTSTYLIVPGVGIGPVHLGMDLDDVRHILGKEYLSSEAENNTVVYLWRTNNKNDELDVFFYNGKAVFIAVSGRDTRYKTSEGLRLWMTREEVVRLLGQPLNAEDAYGRTLLDYDHIQVQINPLGTAFEIGVW